MPNVTGGVALTPEQIAGNQAYIKRVKITLKPLHKHKLALLQGLAHQILDLHIAT
jgi:hypothetical protein